MTASPRPEDVIGEWGVRDVPPRSQNERERLERLGDLNPLAGRPLPRRIRTFRAEPHRYLPSLGGPLPFMRRLRRIDEETEQHLARLAEAYEEHRGDPAGWRQVADTWRFDTVNELIERHNRWYPVEANLPMDPRTRDFVPIGGASYRREHLDAAWVLDHFPA